MPEPKRRKISSEDLLRLLIERRLVAPSEARRLRE